MEATVPDLGGDTIAKADKRQSRRPREARSDDVGEFAALLGEVEAERAGIAAAARFMPS
jgi:hypothetical protein